MFEPSFPQYQDHIQMAQGIFKHVPLELNEGRWTLDIDKFRHALSPNTKMVIINNAHNPTGMLFSREQLEEISSILKGYPRVIVLSDDVYEFLTFDGKETTLFGSLGDNFQKTVSIFSGGKLFSATGWKVGWAVGPADIIGAAAVIATTTIYCVNAPAQVAMARCLGERIENQEYKDGMTYLQQVKLEYEQVRDLMFKELSEQKELPLVPLKTESGFFLMVDISKCVEHIPKRYLESHDYEVLKEGEAPVSKNKVFMADGRVPYDLAFCRWMAVERGVIMMPNSLFYHKASPYRIDTLVRLSICKGVPHSSKAVQRLIGKL